MKVSKHTMIGLLAAMVALGGCASEDDGEDEAPKYASDGPVRFYEHVAPIYKDNCTSCHVEGGIAPFRLDDLDAARKYGLASKVAVKARTMPPWGVLDDGSCSTYKHSRWLSEADVETIADWVDGKMPAGDASKDPGKADPSPPLKGGVEYIMPVTYTPQDDLHGGHHEGEAVKEFDDYRCFAIPLGQDKDRFITAVEVVPGEPKVVHHVVAFAVNPNGIPMAFKKYGTNQQVIDALVKAEGDRPGWPCYGAVGEGVAPGPLLVAWAPGGGVNKYPEGTGLRVRKGDMLVVQMHYNVTGKPLPDRSKIRIKWADTVDREAWIVLHDPFLFTEIFAGKGHPLEAGKSEVPFNWKATLDNLSHTLPKEAGTDLQMYGVFPHMHKRGRGMDVMIQQDGGPQKCATKLHHWDFNWQQMYWFQEPLTFNAKTKLDATCTFDTSKETHPVLPGLGSDDEMCLLGMYLVKK